jgi:hypothetical protein
MISQGRLMISLLSLSCNDKNMDKQKIMRFCIRGGDEESRIRWQAYALQKASSADVSVPLLMNPDISFC